MHDAGLVGVSHRRGGRVVGNYLPPAYGVHPNRGYCGARRWLPNLQGRRTEEYRPYCGAKIG